jgi:predicted phage terminase large subunit-like protein
MTSLDTFSVWNRGKSSDFQRLPRKIEIHDIETPYGPHRFQRRAGEALHPEREPLEILNRLREALGEYNFAAQYLQSPAPLGGGMVKAEWFKAYTTADVPKKFELILQSWDTANKPTELSDFSVCTTWGVKEKHLYLLHVIRKRLGYPELKRTVREQAELFDPQTILIEDRESGTQLIQELVGEGMHAIKSYEPAMDKIMRLHSVTSTIENGFVHLPDKACWLAEYLHELTIFPKGENDDQADSTSQALDWLKNNSTYDGYGLLEWAKQEKERVRAAQQAAKVPESRICSRCDGVMSQRIPGGLRCAQCGMQWPSPGSQPRVQYPNRTDVLNSMKFLFGR